MANEESTNQFTQSFIDTFQKATSLAEQNRNSSVDDVHFMAAACANSNNPLASLLTTMGVNLADLNMKLQDLLQKEPKVSNPPNNIPVTPALSSHLQKSLDLRKIFKDAYASLELYLIALVADRNARNNDVVKILHSLPQAKDFTEDHLIKTVQFLRQGRTVDEQSDNALDDEVKSFLVDLTEQAEQGKLDPVIGRYEEINRCLQILQRRSKNNPVLIGKPGVGKTAIIEGIAQLITQGKVSDSLKGARIYALDMGALMSGTQYRGSFEKKIKKLLDSIKDRNVILFIDELHLIVQAGASGGDDNMNLANMLKPVLSRGEVHCIGATTLAEYAKYIEKDSALERRFQRVVVNEPSVEDTINILRGIKEKYSIHHHVQITDSAIISAAQLSNRYITDRTLPDKAIDLIDEAASKINIEISSEPTVMKNIHNELDELKISEYNLANEEDEESKKRLEAIREKIKEKEREYESFQEILNAEKNRLNRDQKLKEELDRLQFEAEKALQNGEYERVSEIKYNLIPKAQKELDSLAQDDTDYTLIRTKVTDKEVTEIVSQMTGIPLNKLEQSEKQKLLELEKVLGTYVIGQQEAISAVSNAIRRSRAGIQDERKPLGSFLFLGSTGVGKTELARALAYQLFDNEDSIIRIDMSEYMESHSVSRLIGAPPGYVGYDQGGLLTEAVRRAPYSIVLFDEVEKAHRDVFNIFLQILDNGQLTDGQGRVVNFRNTVVIMTSNMGSKEIMEHSNESYDEVKSLALDIVKQQFRPEILNRIDDIVVFHPLEREHMRAIARIQLDRLNKRLDLQERRMEISDDALDYLCNVGYDREFGARPLKRVITTLVENPMSKLIISGASGRKSLIKVSLNPNFVSDAETPDVEPLVFSATHDNQRNYHEKLQQNNEEAINS